MKPELVDYGGNYVLDSGGGQVRSNPGTDVMMASAQRTPALAHDSGSSFAAPRVSHKLALVLSDLRMLGVSPVSSPLLKAFLVNSASRNGLALEPVEELEQIRRGVTLNTVGYGISDAGFATDCSSFSAVLYYQGSLQADRVAFFEIPVPSALTNAGDGKKRLTVTLAHAPQVQRWGLERYLGSTMKWRLFRGDVNQEDVISAMSVEDVGDADSQPERPKELQCELKVNVRSRGCVQHDVYEWNQHQVHYSESAYTLAVASYSRWDRRIDPIPFAIVVRLKDMSGRVQVYSEVQSILAQLEIKARASI